MENSFKLFSIPIIYSLLVLIISVWNFDQIELNKSLVSDKLVHFIIYFLFVIIWSKPFDKYFKSPIKLILIFSTLFGFLIEIIQLNIHYRSFEIYDIIFNLLGSLSACFVISQNSRLL